MPMTTAERLDALAANLWWSWDAAGSALWLRIDSYRWERSRHNPVVLLADLEADRRAELQSDAAFAADVRAIHTRFQAYLEDRSTWCDRECPDLHGRSVAYLSMEFGLHESLRLYSGGLGVLAGDHLRSASDLGIPLTAVGLIYREGYFRQVIDGADQVAAYPEADYGRLPLTPVVDPAGKRLVLTVPIENRTVRVQVWRLDVGRVPLYLLDTDLPGNTADDRSLTQHLYGGDHLTRVKQEVLLGLGGVRLLTAIGVDPDVMHLNEGHCAFAPLQLAADRLADGDTFPQALAHVKRKCVFTTHTPVPAGHDRFGWRIIDQVLGPWRKSIGLAPGAFMDLGRVDPGDWNEPLCMTVLALRASSLANGVSALHGQVSREMWHGMWPELDVSDVPIGHVTNGVHPVFWMGEPARELYDARVPGWREAVWDPAVWEQARSIPDAELWALRNTLRARLVAAVATRTGKQLDPNALTIGFARRFAPYKRGDLIFSDPERLARLLDAGAQIIYSGKAHPQDTLGKEIVRRVIEWSDHKDFRERVVFVPDYDIVVGRLLTTGADVWLNNPRRPREASGTSGQKVCFNGGLNLSVLDGWWPEGFDGTNGWSIGDTRDWEDTDAQDTFDAADLYAKIEGEVWTEWSTRDANGRPTVWLDRIRSCIATCAPKFSSHRMVRDYALQSYSLLASPPLRTTPAPRDAQVSAR
ncbi:MAG: starch phosphorylase [Myxococcota bacterium]|jgi:starch phosphorylase